MNEREIKDQMATFIVEMEQTEDPRLKALETEKAALEVTLEEVRQIDSCSRIEVVEIILPTEL